MSRSGGDDYQPHPGDPWHPDWTPDADEAEELEAAATVDVPVEADTEASSDEGPDEPRRRRFGLFRRRGEPAADEPEVAEPPAESPPMPDVSEDADVSEEDVAAPAPVVEDDRLDAAEDEEAIWASVLAGDGDTDDGDTAAGDLGVEDPEVAYQALQELEQDDELDQWVAFLDDPEEPADADEAVAPDPADSPAAAEVPDDAQEVEPTGPTPVADTEDEPRSRRWWPFGRSDDDADDGAERLEADADALEVPGSEPEPSGADEPPGHRDEPAFEPARFDRVSPPAADETSTDPGAAEADTDDPTEVLPTAAPADSDIAAALGELARIDPTSEAAAEEEPPLAVPEITSEEAYDETHEADLVADLMMDVSAAELVADLGTTSDEPRVESELEPAESEATEPVAEYEDPELEPVATAGEPSSLGDPSEEDPSPVAETAPATEESEEADEDELAAALAALDVEVPEPGDPSDAESDLEPVLDGEAATATDEPTQLTIDGTVGDEDVPPAHDEIDEVATPDAGDPGRLPSSWFAEIDEDEVEPPPHTVPEDDYEAVPPPEPAEIDAVAAVDAVMEDALDMASDLDVVGEEPAVGEPLAEDPLAADQVAEEPLTAEPVAEAPVVEEPVSEAPLVEEPVAEEPLPEEPLTVEEPAAAGEAGPPDDPGSGEFALPDFGEFDFEDDLPVAPGADAGEPAPSGETTAPPDGIDDDLMDGDVVWRASDGEPDEPGLWAPAGPPRIPLGHDDDEPTAEVWPPDLGYEHPGAPDQDPEFVPEPDESLDVEAAMAAAFDELDRAAPDDPPFEPAAPGVPEPVSDEPTSGEEYSDGAAGEPPWEGDREAASTEVYDQEDAELSEGLYAGAGTVEHRGLAEAVEAASLQATERTALSAPMAGIETGIVGFEDVEDLGTGEEYEEPAPSDLGVRVATGVTLIVLVIAAVWAGGEWLAVLLGGFVLLALYEFYRTLRSQGYHPVTVFGYLGAIATYTLTWFHGPVAIPASIVATAVVVYFVYTFTPQRTDALTNGGLTVLGVAWIAGTAAFALPIVATDEFRVLVFGVVIATVAMDVGAYFFGRSFGNARLAPVLSPNKSIEGLAGGVMLCLAATIAWGWLDLSDPLTIRTGAWLGLVVALAAPLGDLAESMVKRSLGVKDMGSILPGHGGILDRIDAFLFAIPPAWVLFEASGLLV